jgi:hypothetical protein
VEEGGLLANGWRVVDDTDEDDGGLFVCIIMCVCKCEWIIDEKWHIRTFTGIHTHTHTNTYLEGASLLLMLVLLLLVVLVSACDDGGGGCGCGCVDTAAGAAAVDEEEEEEREEEDPRPLLSFPKRREKVEPFFSTIVVACFS